MLLLAFLFILSIENKNVNTNHCFLISKSLNNVENKAHFSLCTMKVDTQSYCCLFFAQYIYCEKKKSNNFCPRIPKNY